MINNDCKLLINLNQLVRDRPNGQDLDVEHVDQIANDLRRNMNFDSFYEQADVAITDYCDDVGYLSNRLSDKNVHIGNPIHMISFINNNLVIDE